MIIACDIKNRYIQASQADKTADYFCPGCREKVILKSGDIKQKHFSHCIGSTCATFTENETLQHLVGKIEIADNVQQYGQIQIEAVLPNIQQRPDILLICENKKIAIEYQCSPISQQKLNQRNEGYKKENIQVIWILGDNYFKRRMSQASIIKFMKDNALIFYLPEKKHFVHRQQFTKPDFTGVKFTEHISKALFNIELSPQRKNLNLSKQVYKLQHLIMQRRIEPRLVDYLYQNNRLLIHAPTWIHEGNTFGLKISNWHWRLIAVLFLEKIGQQNIVNKQQLSEKLSIFLLGNEKFKQQKIADLYHDLEINNYILQHGNYILVRRLPRWKNEKQQKTLKI
ncbi:competence protein CoiA [Leuconostoc litchii]|uniref:Competence protein n=2 Tax=Leuconostoc litchii TaxID=1981069 RepID=A0A6P2CQ07_9LACO|nr:competence protein CoiA family protein [Leuconostoc litchii]TYC47473.1 competence protein [Leuconostoc litchii]